MHCNNKSTHTLNFLLLERFGSSSPCLQRSTLWAHGSNIIHWWWAWQGPLKSKVEWIFPWAIQRTWVIQEQGAMVRPLILVATAIEKFTLCKDGLCPFQCHYAVFEVIFQLSIFIIFLVQAVSRKFKWGSSDIPTSFRWLPK